MTAVHHPGDGVSKSRLLDMYTSMQLIRESELAVVRLISQSAMPGFVHSYIGQEAVAVGVCSALRSTDFVVSTHRGHGHFIAKGGDLSRFFAELYGRSTGCCRGKGGSMHIADPLIGFLGANAIVGAGIPIAAGAALALQMQGRDDIVVSFFGDGAVDTGAFHEAMCLAGIWKVPAVFVCENNLYTEFMARRDIQAVNDVRDRVLGYGIRTSIVDGNDVEAVLGETEKAIKLARSGDGPTFIEAKTYRLRGHYEGDPQGYRSAEEKAEWRRRDPIRLAETRLLEAGDVDGDFLASIQREALGAVDAAIKFAESSPMPTIGDALTSVYANRVEAG